MTTLLDKLESPIVGDRLRIARENAKITQARAAKHIGVARTTLVAIEQGQRRIRIDELQQLAVMYGLTVNGLLRQEAIHVDIEPRFRKLVGTKNEEALEAAKLMSQLAQAEVELENLLGIQHPSDYPPERPFSRGKVELQAEQDALELRQRLGLGLRPISDIVVLLEMEMGVRVYVRRIDSSISGLFSFDEKVGPCIMLNANHPKERRYFTAAHECGHFISNRKKPEVLYEHEKQSSLEESYANAFAKAFLMPAGALKLKFQDIVSGSKTLTRRHVIVLAQYFGVSREALVRRLEELKLARKGAWDYFQDTGGITNEQSRMVLGDLVPPDQYKAEADRPTTIRLNLLAAEAYRQELLSEGQLAKLLHLDRVQLREILSDSELEEGLH